MNKDILQYTRNELLAIENFNPGEPFNAIVIIPTGEQHDSGYGCMKFILMRNREIVGAVGGYSDVVHINGFGGIGRMSLSKLLANGDMMPRVGWRIDCLPGSGCLRLFAGDVLCRADDFVGSDFVFYVEKEGGENG